MTAFISYATADELVVLALRNKLAERNINAVLHSVPPTEGDFLEAEFAQAISNADMVLVVLSRHTINSPGILSVLQLALRFQQEHGINYPVIPLLLPGANHDAVRHWFPNGPPGISLEITPEDLDRAATHLVSFLAERMPTAPSPVAIAELILELCEPALVEQEGKAYAVANATLYYRPALSTAAEITTASFRFVSPPSLIAQDDLNAYLVDPMCWPTATHRHLAEDVERMLSESGQALYRALCTDIAKQAVGTWEAVASDQERRFTIRINTTPLQSSAEDAQLTADEAANRLLALPWELLHNGRDYVFPGKENIEVRRQPPVSCDPGEHTTGAPLRVLLISPRLDFDHVPYVDHRARAIPLVEALKPLGSLAELTILTPATFEALQNELLQAKETGAPYHIVYFDGHGSAAPPQKLAVLYLEDPHDEALPPNCGSVSVDVLSLAALLRNANVSLVFLDVYGNVQGEGDPGPTLAGKLLEGGISSVIAMTHRVLPETIRCFLSAFHRELLRGARIGRAMRHARQTLKDVPVRANICARDLRLEDWFVPVLYQAETDPQLVVGVPDSRIQAERTDDFDQRMGSLPETPQSGFVGRSSELLRAERMLAQHKHVVFVGQSGEGKTTLACELARWQVVTRQARKAAFVALEQALTPGVMIALLGRQLVPHYTSSVGKDSERGLQEVEHALAEQPTVIVLDNMETTMPPPEGSPDAMTFDPQISEEIFSLCEKLQQVGETRLILISRQTLPVPFARHTVSVEPLSPPDAVTLVAQTLARSSWQPDVGTENETNDAIDRLTEVAENHARTLALLTLEIRRFGIRNATNYFSRRRASIEQAYPGEPDNPWRTRLTFALDRMPQEMRQRIRPLGIFQVGVSPLAILLMLKLEDLDQAHDIRRELLRVGLAEEQGYGFLRFAPMLPAILFSELSATEQGAARAHISEMMVALAQYLIEQRASDVEFAEGLARRELPNLLAALKVIADSAEEAQFVRYATTVASLTLKPGHGSAFERIRAVATSRIGDWNHIVFEAERAAIERMLTAGHVIEAADSAESLLQRCTLLGERAYAEADYDRAMAYRLVGFTRKNVGACRKALPALADAERRFAVLAQSGNAAAAQMASTARTDRADCLVLLGHLVEAATLYEQTMWEAVQQGDRRIMATASSNLGMVQMLLQHHTDALQTYAEARKNFEHLGDLQSVAAVWNQTGMVYREFGNYAAAERAYRASLQIELQLNHRAGQADSLLELGNLHHLTNRLPEAIRFFREAAAIYTDLPDDASEGLVRNNWAISLLQLGHYDEARHQLQRAIACKTPFGHLGTIWETYGLLHELEQAVGNAPAAKAARDQAVQAYLTYRRDGGENLGDRGRIFERIREARNTVASEGLAAELITMQNAPDTPDDFKRLVPTLLRILAGERKLALADDPSLDYDDAVEVRLLLEE